ncbi:MAG: DUF1800 domain-containing protein [Bacteroidetes bacterium]|nr:DUF1800 domain-containing protein [Bacteroidota bacterium]
MSVTLQQKNQHLLWRAGFGVDLSAITTASTLKTKNILSTLFDKYKETPILIDVADESLKKMYADVAENNSMNPLEKVMDKFSKEQRQQIQKQSREDIKKLNLKWLDEMVTTNNPLREKMSLFWHGHFACRDQNIFQQQNLLQIIRTNALGSFKDLLFGVSKSAGMLAFLNNQQNKKQHPNENFAREVMELFTLGRGNYTEEDIKEAARAFTGWSFKLGGEFIFRKNLHDDGSKTVLGKTGSFNGDDVLNILLEQKQTAKYITQKIYKYFVNDVVDKDKVDWLSKRFYNSDYNIAELMKDIFSSDWFYDEKNIGAKIKSPVELLVGIRRQLNITLNKPEVQLIFQNALGQVLFYPPNVAGWPGGKNWIDSSSLMLRLQIPRLIKDDEELLISTKTDDDVQMGMMEKLYNKMQIEIAKKYRISAKINWADYIKLFEKVERNNLLNNLKSLILQTDNKSINNSVVENNINTSSREEYIKTATVALMSCPEYQLC